ncbi:MAG: hypothetical protein J6K29_03435 [Clostridia bacterium]|nr:hypothetical protein [Clostridia bacterium]
MDILKKLFPLSWKFTGSVANLIIGVLVYLVVDIVLGVAISLLSSIPVVGIIISLIGSLIGLYTVGGIVVMFLAHFKVLKD